MEKLICDCGNDTNHFQYQITIESGIEYIVKCAECGRFLKVVEPQPDENFHPENIDPSKLIAD